MPRRYLAAVALCGLLAYAAGCAKGNPDFSQGKKAEDLQDYDTALAAYNRALKADPNNSLYKIRADQMRFEAAQAHLEQGQKIREKGDLQMALAEFRKAQEIDPSNAAAAQEVQNTLALITAKEASEATPTAPPAATGDQTLLSAPPQLKPLSPSPINLKMVNDSKVIFETIGKLAGVTVIFDPEFTSRRIPIELDNVTLEQALDIAAMESKAYWKPVTSNIIFVTMDQTQKRHDYEPEVVRTFYLGNTLEPNDLTEITTGLRTLFDLRHVQQINAQNAIIIRDTPDKVMLASKVIDDIDKAKPEVIIQVAVLTANRDRTRDLGINPGTSASLTFAPPGTSSSSSSTTTSSATSIALNELKHLSTADYQITLPSATANALLTDSKTRIIQNPEIRDVDGQEAKLKIGERVPVATGSFQAGVGVGTTSGAGIVNPLVNTQFTYLDVGVNVNVTPRVHPDGDVSMKLTIDISAVAGTSNIGGISQPIIAQQDVENEVRLKDGEVNIIGGLIQQNETLTLSGWPGLQKIPVLRDLFADNSSTNNDDELLIVLIPHVVRMPAITAENLQSLYSGTDTNPGVLTVGDVASPAAAPATPAPAPATAAPTAQPPQGQAAQLDFNPAQVTMKPGEEKTISIVANNFQDLFSTPMLLQYDPKIISVEEVKDGGFLSGGSGTQDYALVQRVDPEHGQAIISATRMPNKPGVSGSGTLLGIQIKALAPGQTKLSIVQVNARDSQQRPIPVVTGEVTVQVAP